MINPNADIETLVKLAKAIEKFDEEQGGTEAWKEVEKYLTLVKTEPRTKDDVVKDIFDAVVDIKKYRPSCIAHADAWEKFKKCKQEYESLKK